MKLLHAADLHLDSPMRGLERYEGAPAEELRGATRAALENLVGLAIEESVALVLIAGDLYDGDWRDYNTGLFFVRQMARLQEADIPVVLIAGNHDAASQITKVLHPPANVRVLATHAPESVPLEALGVAVHGQGFATRAVTEDLTRGYPRALSGLFNIGLLHTSLDGRPGHEPYAPSTVDGLRSLGYDYWALGHVHAHEVVARDPWIVFPGNTQGRHARETGPKGCCLVEVEDQQVRALEHRALDVVRWALCTVDLAPARTLEEVYERVAAALAQATAEADGRLLAARLRLVGHCALDGRLRADREQLVNECRALGSAAGGGLLWIEKLQIDTRPPHATPPLPPEEALGGLLRAIGDLQGDPAALAEELADLALKLPPELRAADDPFDPRDPATLRDALADVRELLVERLLAQGGRGR